MKMLLVAIFALSCAQISNAVTSPGFKWFDPNYTTPPYPTDIHRACSDPSINTPGVYLIQPSWDVQYFEVYCDNKDGKMWTVIQQRFNASVDFYRTYAEYTKGFGPLTGNHWLGLEKIHQLTKYGDHELRVELTAFDANKGQAHYSTFKVDSEKTGFQITISGFNKNEGFAGDSLLNVDDNNKINGMKFTTFDKDQDMTGGNCAEYCIGAWWYNACTFSNLNGPYKDKGANGHKTINWRNNFGFNSLKNVRMLIKRR